MSESRQFSRQVLNGKIVYVPESTAKLPPRQSHSRPKRLISLTFGPWIATGAMLSVATLVAASTWLSWQALSNPDVAFWLNRFVPATGTIEPGDRPRTLAQIQQALKTSDQQPGEPVILTGDFSFRSPLRAANDLLIPVSRLSCEGRVCPKLTELHIYRSLQLPFPLRLLQGERYYHRLDRITVEGPTEAQLIKLVRHSDLVSRSHPLPLTSLQEYPLAPKPGKWLRLSGLKTSGSSTSSYGQMFYFHPDEGYLGLMLNWASPKGAFPVWQQVIEGGQPELFLDQSVGLEPQFAVHQIETAPNGALQLRPVQLSKPAFEHPTYAKGLRLARSGLWRPAQNLLLTVKAKQPQKWSPQAQAQLTLIQLHAEVTEKRAQQPASNPIQKIVAYTINGNWGSAVGVFEAQRTRPEAVKAMLAADSGRLLGRVEAALSVQPDHRDAMAWGAMIVHVQKGPVAAFDWVRERTPNPQAVKRIQKLLERLETASAPKTPSPFDAAKKEPLKKEPLKKKPLPSPSVTPVPPPAVSPIGPKVEPPPQQAPREQEERQENPAAPEFPDLGEDRLEPTGGAVPFVPFAEYL